MLEGLLWSLLGLIAAILAVLAVPLDLAARLDLGARPRLVLQIAWLFGLVRLRQDVGGRKPAARKEPKASKKHRGVKMPSLAVLRRGFALFGQLLRRVRIRRVELDLSLGADDPAATGELAGYAAPIVVMANSLPRTRVTFTPDFAGPAFEGAGAGEIRVVPLTLLPPVVGFALSPEVRRWLFARG